MSQPPAAHSPVEQPKTYLAAWIAALALILVFVLGLLMFPPTFTTVKDAPKAPDSILFVGRFHPVVVHAPIGALMLLAVFELLCLRRKNEEKFGDAALLILTVGAAGAVAGVLVGILLSREGGFEGANFALHQTIGIGATTGILLALVLRISAMGSGHGGLMDCYRVTFLLSLGFISLGAHFGGNITHGNKYLTEYAPPFVAGPMVGMEKWMHSLVAKPDDSTTDKPEAPPPPKPPEPVKPPAPVVVASNNGAKPDAPVQAIKDPPPPATGATAAGGETASIAADDSVTVFQNVLLPVLEEKCNKCHNEEKSKGDLRMDTHELLLKGGEGEPGKTVIPGKPDESLAIVRIKLPIDDDDHMPPEGKEQMTDEETALLHWWIQEGASATLKVKDAKFPAQMKPLVESLLKK
jgi:Planctomycete cytochrome C